MFLRSPSVQLNLAKRMELRVYLKDRLLRGEFEYREQTLMHELHGFLAKMIGGQCYYRTADPCLDYLLSLPTERVTGLQTKSLIVQALPLCTELRGTSLRDYDVLRQVGVGGFSKVFLVQGRFSGRFYAMKVIPKDN
jgi:hypothetical protein